MSPNVDGSSMFRGGPDGGEHAVDAQAASCFRSGRMGCRIPPCRAMERLCSGVSPSVQADCQETNRPAMSLSITAFAVETLRRRAYGIFLGT